MKEAKNIGIDNLIDEAFVPDMSDRQQEQTQSERLHAEAGSYASKDVDIMGEIFASLKGKKVDNGIAETPTDGIHNVRITEHQEGLGRNGNDNYIRFTFRDNETNLRWETFVSVKNIPQWIASVSDNNKAMFEQQDMMLAFKKILMGQVNFNVWTVVRIKDKKVITYVDEERWNKYLYWQNKELGERELNAIKAAERKAQDNVVAEACGNLPPWEDILVNIDVDDLPSAEEARQMDKTRGWDWWKN